MFNMFNQACGVVVTTISFQSGRPGFNPWLDLYTQGLKIIEEKCYPYIDISKWLDFRVFSDKDVKTVGISRMPYQV